ncbi:MAG: M56 family metallopeptidase [Verrucomicrobiales bacterium]
MADKGHGPLGNGPDNLESGSIPGHGHDANAPLLSNHGPDANSPHQEDRNKLGGLGSASAQERASIVFSSAHLFRCLAAVWFLVFLGFLTHAMIRHVRFARHVRRWARPLPSIAPVLEECRGRLKVRQPVSLLEVENLRSPVVFGFWRPRVLLPAGLAGSLTRDELWHIFLHELAHVRCADVLLNWLIIAARCLHWFNPVAWIILRQVLADRELLRDTMALRALSGDGAASTAQRAYGHTLVKLASSFSQPRLSPGLAPLIRTEKEIHRRITLMKTPLLTKSSWPLNLVGAGALATLGALSFTIATGEEEKPKDPPATRREVPAPPSPKPDRPPQPEEADPRVRPAREYGIRKEHDREAVRRDRAEADRVARERDRAERIDQMQNRLSEINREVDGLKKRAETEKDTEVDQELAALREVRAELLKEFYRAKYVLPAPPVRPGAAAPSTVPAPPAGFVPPPALLPPPSPPPPQPVPSPAKTPRAGALLSPPSSSSAEKARQTQLRMETELQINHIKRRLQAIEGKKGDDLIRAASDMALMDPKMKDVYAAHLKNEAIRQQMLSSGYGQRHPDVKAMEDRLASERGLLEKWAEEMKQNLEDQHVMAEAMLKEIRDMRENRRQIEADSTPEISELRSQLDALRRSIDEMRGAMKIASAAQTGPSKYADLAPPVSVAPAPRTSLYLTAPKPTPAEEKPSLSEDAKLRDKKRGDAKSDLFLEEKAKSELAPSTESPAPKEPPSAKDPEAKN